MNSDIVIQLRNECQCSDDCRAVDDPCIAMRAADEIERLRVEPRVLELMVDNAINEIERLRTELADWQRTVRAHEAENKRLRRAIETFINVYYNCYTTREIESLAIEELKQAVCGE